jgi:hypothetical protein
MVLVAIRKDTTNETSEIKRTKLEWIESAAHLGAERFEVAGALFDVKDDQLVSEREAKQRLNKYKGGDN